MTLTACIVVCALLGVLFLAAAARRLSQRRVLGGLGHGLIATVWFLLAGGAGLVGVNLQTYRRLTAEQPAAELQFTRTAPRTFNAVLSYSGGERTDFALRGDEWQVDARLLKWTAFANLIGFDTAYRLERISGRYTSIEDEKSQPRTVYALHAPGRVDPWELIHRNHARMPWIDALYGSATFLPMSDGALYEIKVSQSGLIARPLNQAARDAVGNWH
jgi:hypothetical protein